MMSTTSDALVRAVAGSGSWLREQRYWSNPIKIRGEVCTTPETVAKRWSASLGQTVDGYGLAPQAIEYPRCHKWLSSGNRQLSGGDFVKAVAVRCGTLPTPLRMARGRPDNSGLCDTCLVPASLRHISQSCPRTKGLRVYRHDDLCKFIHGRLKQHGYRVTDEQRLTSGATFRKPDLVGCRGNTGVILDVQVTSDRFPHANKVTKYSSL